jgi:hypothetical protein
MLDGCARTSFSVWLPFRLTTLDHVHGRAFFSGGITAVAYVFIATGAVAG